MKSIGIIGGMGPMATVDLFRRIVMGTPAQSDREHIRIFIDNNTAIPDRTQALLHGGEDPVPEMVNSAIRLEAMGADFLIMPCNTAHAFYDRLLPFVHVPILHMIRETLEDTRRRSIPKVGLLATDGTIRTRVYHDVFEQAGIELILPDAQGQEELMRLIYQGVKAGRANYDTAPLRRALDETLSRGAQALILGCTELPLAFAQYEGLSPYPAIDPTAILAAAAIREAGIRTGGKE